MSYLLGMSPAEIDRLRRQHEAWHAQTTAVWRSAGFRAGQTIVDLGCGPGFTSMDLARVVGPSGRVVAVDASRVATDYLRAVVAREGVTHVDVVTTDVCDLKLGAEGADGVFARWLFSFLPDPADVIRRLVSDLRPGAMIAVIDYWNYLALRSEPDAEEFRTVFRAVHAAFAEAGGSLDVAGRLPAALENASVRVQSIEPLVAIGRPGSPVWRWLEDFLSLHLPALVEGGRIDERDVHRFWTWWRDVAESPGTLVMSPPMLAIVGVKGK